MCVCHGVCVCFRSPACAPITLHAAPVTSRVSGTVDASDLVHAPVLFAADAKTGLPCVVVNVHEGTLSHLCGLHPTLAPVVERLVVARLITAAISRAPRKGTQLNLRI
jgi:hypothetical protein